MSADAIRDLAFVLTAGDSAHDVQMVLLRTRPANGRLTRETTGITSFDRGPTAVAAFTNQNHGDFRELEATLGRIAEDIIDSWR